MDQVLDMETMDVSQGMVEVVRKYVEMVADEQADFEVHY